MKHGLEISKEIKNELKSFFANNKSKIIIVSVGNNKQSENYISWKQKDCLELGINSEHINYDTNISYESLRKNLLLLNNSDCNGIILQLPLPKHLDKYKQDLIDIISPDKDIDGLHSSWVVKRYNNIDCLYPATPTGIVEMLTRNNVKLESKNVAIIGASHLVGYPLMMIMLNHYASPYVLHSKSNLNLVSDFDILIVATGHMHLIKEEHVNKNMIIIDVGITVVNGKLHGDVDPKVKDIVKYVSPVPGGVGPMTRMGIFLNLKKLMINNLNKKTEK